MRRKLLILAVALLGVTIVADVYGWDLQRETVAAHQRLFGDDLPRGRTTVGAVRHNIYKWDSETVLVDGWLGKCAGYDCAIFSSKADASNESLGAWGRGLSLGFISDKFDATAEPLQYSRVLMRAKVNDECFPYGCTDRADMLQPIQIGPWTPETSTPIDRAN